MPPGGHNIKPKSEHEAKGNYRPSRHDRRIEGHANPLETTPKPPAYFDKRHREEWDKCCEYVFGLGILTNPDTYLIETFVCYWFIWKDATAQVQKLGIIIETEKGPIKNPAVNVMNEAAKVVTQIAALFGFSPRARMGIKTDPPKPVDPLDDFNDN